MDSYIITGGGSGIGAAVARNLAQRPGARVLLVGRRREPLEAVVAQIGGAAAGHVILCGDVADRAWFAGALAGPDARLDAHPLIGVFANAGIGGSNDFHLGPEEDRWDEILRVNLTGTYVTAKVCEPYLLQAPSDRPRHLVMTSSILARFGAEGMTAYAAAKTGMLGLMRCLALEWGPSGVLVNAICPGWVETEMAVSRLQDIAQADGISLSDCITRESSHVPTRHFAAPDEVAHLVSYLISDTQRSITGATLDINNGAHMA